MVIFRVSTNSVVRTAIFIGINFVSGLLKMTRTQSLFELCHVSCQFEYGLDLVQARQEVLNRLRLADLPPGISPDISPRTPTGESSRYSRSGPPRSSSERWTRGASGHRTA